MAIIDKDARFSLIFKMKHEMQMELPAFSAQNYKNITEIILPRDHFLP